MRRGNSPDSEDNAILDVVIDAQILGWYYQANELGKAPPCTGDPAMLFSRLGKDDLGILDAGEQIEAEWRRVADTDWFDAWLARRLSSGDITIVEVETCHALLRALETKCGFPRTGDRWYVRTAATRARSKGAAVALITEDVDLYDPKAKKNPKRRARALAGCTGPVVRELAAARVCVRSVARHVG